MNNSFRYFGEDVLCFDLGINSDSYFKFKAHFDHLLRV